MRAIGALALFTLCLAAGCFSLELSAGTVRCHSSAPACPDNYVCGGDGFCYAPGHAPPSSDMGMTLDNTGDKCTLATDCASKYCVDGVCCATDCSDSCNACNVPGKEGTCTPVPLGQTPATGHASCGPDATSTCGRDGTCDGTGLCRKYDSQTVCKPSSCDTSSNLFVANSTCDGNGNCISPSSITCAPYVCKQDGTACYPDCTTGGAECSDGNVCTNSSCGLKVDGSTCAVPSDCESNQCIDSVCCHTACDGQCQACDLTATRGTCATVLSGQPHASHAPCNTSNATCGGSCAGNANACTYPSTSTICQNQSCNAAIVTYASKCDGSGNCAAPTPATLACQAPPTNGAATCNGSSCGISCNPYFAPDSTGVNCVPVWTKEATLPSKALLAIWGSSPSDIYVVSNKDIYHSTGNGAWTDIYSLAANSVWSFKAIWGDVSSPQNVFAVGDGSIYHTTNGGSSWTNEWKQAQLTSLNAVAGGAYNYLFVVGEQVWSQPGGGWTQIAQSLPTQLSCLTWQVGLGTNYFAGGEDGNVYQSNLSGVFSKVYSTGWSWVNGIYGGGPFYVVGPGGGIAYGDTSNNWSKQASGTTNDLYSIYSVANSGTANYYAVGNSGTILFSTGNGTWTAQTSNTTAGLRGVWASGPNDIYAVGYDTAAAAGVIMRLK